MHIEIKSRTFLHSGLAERNLNVVKHGVSITVISWSWHQRLLQLLQQPLTSRFFRDAFSHGAVRQALERRMASAVDGKDGWQGRMAKERRMGQRA